MFVQCGIIKTRHSGLCLRLGGREMGNGDSAESVVSVGLASLNRTKRITINWIFSHPLFRSLVVDDN